jgi:hypothetical protein
MRTDPEAKTKINCNGKKVDKGLTPNSEAGVTHRKLLLI